MLWALAAVAAQAETAAVRDGAFMVPRAIEPAVARPAITTPAIAPDPYAAAAMENGGLPQIGYDTTQLAEFQPAQQPQFTGGPIARQFAAARQEMSGGDGAGQQARPSMADTLQTAFAVAGPDGQVRVPDAVRAAYGRLQQFGL